MYSPVSQGPKGFGFSLSQGPGGGVFIRSVLAGAPGDQAGLRAGDQIVEINGVLLPDGAKDDGARKIYLSCT